MKKDNQRIAVDGFKTFLEEKLKPRFGADQMEKNNKAISASLVRKLIKPLEQKQRN